jgi:hypothetical protein
MESIVLTLHGGFGFDVKTIHVRFGPETITYFYKGVTIFAFIWNATLLFSKSSVLLMYMTVIPNYSMVIWVRCVGITVITWTVAGVLTAALLCKPFALNYDWSLPGYCGSQAEFYFAMGSTRYVDDTNAVDMFC